MNTYAFRNRLFRKYGSWRERMTFSLLVFDVFSPSVKDTWNNHTNKSMNIQSYNLTQIILVTYYLSLIVILCQHLTQYA